MNIDIDKVAHLARLALTPAEAALLGAQLGRVLDYVTELQGVDTTGVEPTSHAVPLETPLRPDVAAPHLPRAEALANAPEHDDEAFIVPRVV